MKGKIGNPQWLSGEHPMKGKLALRPEYQPLELGKIIFESQANGTSLKTLSRQYGYGVTRLRQLVRLYEKNHT